MVRGSAVRLQGKLVPILALEMSVSEVKFVSGVKKSSENAESAVDSRWTAVRVRRKLIEEGKLPPKAL